MGDHKFKLSNMMPNAWFYKLKEMREKKRNSHSNHSQTNMAKRKQSAAAVQSSKPHQLSNPRKSYYFTRDPIANDKFYNPPRQYPKFPDTNIPAGKSPKQTRPRRKLSNSSPKPLSSSVSADSVWTNRSESSPEFSQTSLETEFRSDQALPTEKAFDDTPSRSPESVITEAELPPIVTRRLHFCRADALAGGYIKKREEKKSPSRKLSGHSPRVRIRLNSPRIANKRVGQTQTSARRSSSRRSISDSFAVVKSSFNPQVDFRESMVEMVLENNIRTSKDLEDLLACYLTLNSDEYHDLIIKVFKEIWFDLIN